MTGLSFTGHSQQYMSSVLTYIVSCQASGSFWIPATYSSTCYSSIWVLYVLCTIYTNPLSVQGLQRRSCPNSCSPCYNGSLVTWKVVTSTTGKFKPLIFSVSGFALSYAANISFSLFWMTSACCLHNFVMLGTSCATPGPVCNLEIYHGADSSLKHISIVLSRFLTECDYRRVLDWWRDLLDSFIQRLTTFYISLLHTQ
jgi:hypothetical protein